jgi:hypothetical protein
MKFEENFWSANGDLSGLTKLHARIAQGHTEIAEIISFFTDLAAIHETFSNSLSSLCTRSEKSKDDGSSLKRTFSSFKSELSNVSREFMGFAHFIKGEIITSLSHEAENSKNFRNAKAEMLQHHKTFTKVRDEVEKKREKYVKSCQKLESERQNSVLGERSSRVSDPTVFMDAVSVYQFATLEFKGSSEMEKFLKDIKSSIQLHPVKYVLLGSFQVFSGEQLVQELIKKGYSKSEEESEAIGQSLFDQGIISLVGAANFTSKKFSGKPNWNYTWKKTEENIKQEIIEESEREVQESDNSYKEAVEASELGRMGYEKVYNQHLMEIYNAELIRYDFNFYQESILSKEFFYKPLTPSKG